MSGKQEQGPVSDWGGAVGKCVDPVMPGRIEEEVGRIRILENKDRKSIQIQSEPRLRELKPLHVRIREYREARERIFGEVSNRIKKARERYRKRKRLRKEIAAATLFEGRDARLYTRIEINGREIEGLLDSGATVTCLGRNCLDFVASTGLKVHDFDSQIRTADGTPHDIIGRVRASVTFGQATQVITFYLVPSLSRELFLGVDFMKAFKMFVHLDSLTVHDVPLAEEIENPQDVITHLLSSEQQQKLDLVKSMFPCYTKYGLGKTHLEIHNIDTGDATPVKDRHYPVSPAVQKLMYAELDRMLDLGVIELSESPWSHPVTLVRKGQKNRLCLDARKLNALTVKDAYPLPHIEGLLSRLGDTVYISSVDLKDAFWQIPLDPSSRQKTAFTVPGRPLYQFTVMPFGLCNAAQRLCRLMDKVIPAALRDRVFVYLDDLLIVSPDFATHMELLSQVAYKLKVAGLTINLTKSKFCFKELRYLGYIVGGGKLRPDPAKVETITRFAYPKTAKQVRSFMGATGWYRKFIPDYATISAPIFDTLKKGKQFKFSEEAKVAFDRLKEALVSSPLLNHPDFSRHFYVQCDASDLGVGAVLFQKDDSGEEHPIAYCSHKLTPAQRNYSVTERECLAVVFAIKKFRPYIELMPFSVITDHSSLKWLMSHKDLSGRLARWSLHLQSYDFTIEHRQGKQNVVPDTLSRYDMDEVSADVEGLVDLNSAAFRSDDYLELISTIEKNSKQLPDLKVVEGYVYKRVRPYDGVVMNEDFSWKLWVPHELTKSIIEKSHNSPRASHGGVGKTLGRIREYFYWPNQSTQVRDFVLNCQICRESKPANVTLRPPMGAESCSERPFQRIYIDFLGPYPRSKNGNVYIFIVLDHLTKFVLLRAMPKASTRNVVKFLITEVFHKFGTPEVIVSDNGRQFVSKEFGDLLTNFGVKHMKTAIHAPQANASERVNQSILAAIRAYLQEDHTEWDKYLSEIEYSLRSSVQSSIGVTPYFALFGMNMIGHGGVYKLARRLQSLEDPELNIVPKSVRQELVRRKIRENLHKAYLRNEKTYNIRCRRIKFVPGQEVYRRNFQQSDFRNNFNAKLARKFIKCRILRPVGNSLYEVEDLRGKSLGVFHAKDLKQ